ncbi:lysozyme inhibitor LprI family protein [Dyella soli]|uniref:lysozyme inhibitor LprI family protein n=1 Tax=Dyella soli TaxID=522319 RepID=UPI0013F3C646|nr:lysozyme inhibitor LprI family protein [Dyella soli]
MLLATALLLLGMEGSMTAGPTVASVIGDCWKGRNHAGMSACVEARAKKAQKDLARAENVASDAIQASADEPPGFPPYRKEALARLQRASRDFSQYVASECAYQASLAGKGNGAEDVRLACVAVLDEARAALMSTARPVP